MRRGILFLSLPVIFLALTTRVFAIDRYVPGEYPTIQAAIDDCNNGDTVLVVAGTYYENIHMKNGVTVKGAGADTTTIDGGGNGHVVVFNLASGTISGFTITNSGYSPGYVGGIFTSQCNVRIENNIVVNNNKGIILSSNSTAVIAGNQIIDNTGIFGRGIKLSSSYASIINNVIAGNSYAGISCSDSSPLIVNNTIYDNGHYGIRCNPTSTQVIVNNIIAHNEYGIMALGGSESPVPLLEISYNDVWNNSEANYWYEWAIVCIPEDPCCEPDGASEPFEPQPGTGEISQDPLFADPNNGDYHLKSEGWRWDTQRKVWTWDEVTSRYIDAGNPGSPLADEPLTLDVDPLNRWGENIRINMGAYGGTAEASMPPYDWALLSDMTNDGTVNSSDLGVFVSYWLDSGQCIPSDLNRNQFVNFLDYAVFAQQWSDTLASKAGIEYEITPCDMGLSATEQSDQTRFTVTVEGRYIHFEDTMVANCCPDELELQMTVDGNLITIYEIEYLSYPCLCICDNPVTATLGPFEPGTYTLEVYQKEGYGGFIGSTTVTIE